MFELLYSFFLPLQSLQQMNPYLLNLGKNKKINMFVKSWFIVYWSYLSMKNFFGSNVSFSDLHSRQGHKKIPMTTFWCSMYKDIELKTNKKAEMMGSHSFRNKFSLFKNKSSLSSKKSIFPFNSSKMKINTYLSH